MGRHRSRTWVDGTEVDCPPETWAPETWALRRAGFLGCGFRVVVPGGPSHHAALTRARELAAEVAARLGTRLDDAPWETLLATDGLATEEAAGATPVEVCGGWTHRFRAPLGACTTRVTPLTLPPPTSTPGHGPPRGRGVTLPWQVNEHAPLTGLPALSAHHESRAEEWLREQSAAEPGDVGLWTNTAGHLVDTTAGAPLFHTRDGWRHPVPSAGTVPHHLWERACTRLQATPWTAQESSAVPADLDALLCVAADGRLTGVTSVDGRPLDGAVDDAYAALDAGPGPDTD